LEAHHLQWWEDVTRYLMRHRHTTPFEMVEIKLRVRLPIYVARQWVRHRTASINEYSARYSIVPDEFEVPNENEIMGQSESNRQGSEGALPKETTEWFRKEISNISENSYNIYSEALRRGVSKETARIVLPLNTYTEWYWKTNLWNMFHFLSLRMDAHAQREIRAYANTIAEHIVARIAPISYEAFTDFVLGSTSFSKKEKSALSFLIRGKGDLEKACEYAGLKLKKIDGTNMKTGEGVEFAKKIEAIKEKCDTTFS
jgi:thymidylate synthase (FAD)